MVYEIVTWLRGGVGPSRVPNATAGLTENGGGVILTEEFYWNVTILQRAEAIYGVPLKGGSENEL
jgi:hypothetical protein